MVQNGPNDRRQSTSLAAASLEELHGELELRGKGDAKAVTLSADLILGQELPKGVILILTGNSVALIAPSGAIKVQNRAELKKQMEAQKGNRICQKCGGLGTVGGQRCGCTPFGIRHGSR